MQVSFLRSSRGLPATKSFSLNNSGEVEATSYPNIYEFDSVTENYETLEELTKLWIKYAAKSYCALKGKLHRELSAESRAGSTNSTDATDWFIADIDGLKDVHDVEDAIRRIMPPEFQDVEHIVQYSCSYGVLPAKGLSAHIVWLLTKKMSAPILKTLVTSINLSNTLLCSQLTLNKTGLGLRYPLDRTVNQNDKLIYIAPPLLSDQVKDTTKENRIKFVNGARRAVQLNIGDLSEERNRTNEEKIVNKLREKEGLKKKAIRYKFIDGVQVCSNPDVHTLSAPPKQERGFTYLSLNGGDSYPYWYPDSNPEVLHNWKGEPSVLLKDILPEYWASINNQYKRTITENAKYLVFRDFEADTYYNGIYNEEKNTIGIAKCGSKDRLHDFLRIHNQPIPEAIPDWRYEFKPSSLELIDYTKKVLNKYQATKYIRQPTKGITEIPPVINKVLRSVCGNDSASYEHLINWLACLFQERRKIGTAWVLHGVEGTGKGVLYHKIILPILGERHCAIKQISDFDDNFNEWIETCLLLFIDEACVATSPNTQKIVNQLKNMITEPRGKLRGMRTIQREAEVFANIIFASNNYDAWQISNSDRRFNVAVRQENKLLITNDEVNLITNELAAFAGYMMHFEIDFDKAASALQNTAKEEMRQASMTSIGQFFDAITKGDIEYFTQFLNETPIMDIAHLQSEYEKIMRRWISMIGNEECKIPRAELRIVYSYLQGSRDLTANKFSRMLGHQNVTVSRFHFDNESVSGVITKWKTPKEDVSMLLDNNVLSMVSSKAPSG